MGRWSKRGVRGGWAIAIRNKILVERINSYNFVTRFQREGNSFFSLSLSLSSPFFPSPLRSKPGYSRQTFLLGRVLTRARAQATIVDVITATLRDVRNYFAIPVSVTNVVPILVGGSFFFSPTPFRNNIFDGRISNDFLLQLNLSPFYFLSSFFKFPSLRK